MNKLFKRVFYQLFHLSEKPLKLSNEMTNSFSKEESDLAFKRLHIISWCIVAVSPIYGIMDMQLLKDVGSTRAVWNLTAIHVLSFLFACIYVILYRVKPVLNSQTKQLILYFFVMFYLSIGAFGSINSIGLSENVDSYIVIMMAVATLLPLRPMIFGIVVFTIHCGFSIAIYQVNMAGVTNLIKLVNTSAAMCISILIVTLYYQYRRSHFFKEQELIQGEINFRTLFEVNPYPLFMIREINSTISLQSNQSISLAAEFGEVDLVQFMTKPEMKNFIKEVKINGTVKDFAIAKELKNGQKRWLLMNGERLVFNHEPSILIGFSDISQLKAQEEDLILHASKDSLTSCYNRRSGMLHLEAMMQEDLHDGLVVCFLDINNLKLVNDQFGHAEGDKLIQTICQLIENHQLPKDLFFRYGGDEFVLAFHNCNLLTGKERWEKIQETILLANQLLDKPYTMSVSSGFSFFVKGMSVTIDELISDADSKMYINKHEIKQNLV